MDLTCSSGNPGRYIQEWSSDHATLMQNSDRSEQLCSEAAGSSYRSHPPSEHLLPETAAPGRPSSDHCEPPGGEVCQTKRRRLKLHSDVYKSTFGTHCILLHKEMNENKYRKTRPDHGKYEFLPVLSKC